MYTDLLYLSATRHFTIKFTNTGSITAENLQADPYEFFNVDKEVLQLEPGESVYLAFSIYWPKAYTNSTNSAHYSLELTTEVPFEQIKAN